MLADEAPAGLNDRFVTLYSENGQRSIPLEQLPRPLLLQAFRTIRSERQLMERLKCNVSLGGVSGRVGWMFPFKAAA